MKYISDIVFHFIFALAAFIGQSNAITFQGGKCIANCELQETRFINSVDPACEEIRSEIRQTLCITEDNDDGEDADGEDADDDTSK
jgi:hypothetical protein